MRKWKYILKGVPGYLPVGFFLFILYGSLLPFEYRPVSMENAWSRFVNIPYLELGIASRADWIANILIYLPLSFFSLAWLEQKIKSVFSKLAAMLAIFLVYSAAALSIEFCQIFISPRTVSLNDIIAELMGILFGLLLWVLWGRTLIGYWRVIMSGGSQALRSAFCLYFLGYLALVFFPYDFLVSWTDLSWKLKHGSYAAVILPGSLDRPFRCFFSFGLEMVLTLPIGMFLGFKIHADPRQWLKVFFYGGLLGIFVEGGQFFLASGVTQGASILTRVFGIWAGVWGVSLLRTKDLSLFRPWLKRLLYLGIIPYVFALLVVNGYFNHGWIPVDQAVTRLEGKMFLPFYYHYFSTETRALLSLLYNVAMYVPVGAGCWLMGCLKTGKALRFQAVAAFLLGGIAAACVEFGKLMLRGKHPDFTNGLIAGAAAVITVKALNWMARMYRFHVAEYRVVGE